MKLKIDNHELELDRPVSIYQAARAVGIEIPTLCHDPAVDHFTSCMICMVKEKKSGRLLPACSAPIADGMEIETINDEIRGFRKATLELLLSDHVGDCEAPCQCLCPLQMEIPRMIREIRADRLDDAIRTVRRDIAIPSILERFCNVPCERGCRRGKHDEPLSIRELTRHVADWDLKRNAPELPPAEPASGKRVAIVGAGATGLSASWYLALRGHACVIFETTERIGGRIESEFKQPLEDWVVEGELAVLRRVGVELRFNRALGAGIALPELQAEFDAIVLACGRTDVATLRTFGLAVTDKSLVVNAGTFETGTQGIFAAGSLLKPGQPLVKSVAAARELSVCVDQYLRGHAVTGSRSTYNHTMGRLIEGEMVTFLRGAEPIPRIRPADPKDSGLTPSEAATETTRCLHCDCRANHDCKLRLYSDTYGARQTQFAGEGRAAHTQICQHGGALYEPGKCIKCGLCIRITQQEAEPYGFAFVGRGFDVKPGVALEKTLSQGLGKVADRVIETCPTGALVHREEKPDS